MDKNFIERITGIVPTEKQEEYLTTLAECVYYVLVNTKGSIGYNYFCFLFFYMFMFLHYYLIVPPMKYFVLGM